MRFRHRVRLGFTLVELLVVIAVIATLVAVVAPSIFGNVGQARQTAARSQVEIFGLALDSFRLDVHEYPTTSDGLAALRVAPSGLAPERTWRGPYLRSAVPNDPWGRPYIYVAPGRVNPESYDLYSLGRDGRAGGVGEDEDVTSWKGPVSP